VRVVRWEGVGGGTVAPGGLGSPMPGVRTVWLEILEILEILSSLPRSSNFGRISVYGAASSCGFRVSWPVEQSS
jgi:hypothetical protein